MGIFGNISSRNNSEQLNTIIGDGSELDGELTVAGSIRIDGKLSGKLSASGHITIGAKGVVISPSIHCISAHIAGEVRGDIIAPERVHLTNTAIVNGNITTQIFVIEQGARFNGTSEMKEENF
ncbi:polymer-forming cytoskeletal protein [bacterium]|nr:polymer-forming cytoskeletal protein [bacterium]